MRLAELHHRILIALHHGDSLDEVEEEITELAPLDEERKAALSLYAMGIAERHRRRPTLYGGPLIRGR